MANQTKGGASWLSWKKKEYSLGYIAFVKIISLLFLDQRIYQDF